jgi:hypothetical protein
MHGLHPQHPVTFEQHVEAARNANLGRAPSVPNLRHHPPQVLVRERPSPTRADPNPQYPGDHRGRLAAQARSVE